MTVGASDYDPPPAIEMNQSLSLPSNDGITIKKGTAACYAYFV